MLNQLCFSGLYICFWQVMKGLPVLSTCKPDCTTEPCLQPSHWFILYCGRLCNKSPVAYMDAHSHPKNPDVFLSRRLRMVWRIVNTKPIPEIISILYFLQRLWPIALVMAALAALTSAREIRLSGLLNSDRIALSKSGAAAIRRASASDTSSHALPAYSSGTQGPIDFMIVPYPRSISHGPGVCFVLILLFHSLLRVVTY